MFIPLGARVWGWLSLPPTLGQADWEIPASSAARLVEVAGPRMKLARRFAGRGSYADERRYSLYANPLN